MNKLLLELLNSELTSAQKKEVEDFLYDLLVEERLNREKEFIKSLVSDELADL